MSYTYKLANNGPTLKVDEEIKITKEEFTKGGAFSNDVWEIWHQTPSSRGTSKIEKGMSAIHGIGGSNSIEINW